MINLLNLLVMVSFFFTNTDMQGIHMHRQTNGFQKTKKQQPIKIGVCSHKLQTPVLTERSHSVSPMTQHQSSMKANMHLVVKGALLAL